MNIQILHECRGRIRFHIVQRQTMTSEQADMMAYHLSNIPSVTKARVCYRTGNAVVHYEGRKEELLCAVEKISTKQAEVQKKMLELAESTANNRKHEKMMNDIAIHLVMGVMPKPVQVAYSAYGYYQKMVG